MTPLTRLITTIDARTGFDRWGPDANPLVRRVKRQPTRLSLGVGLWLAVVIGLVGLWPGVRNALRITTYNMSDAEAIIVMMGWPLYFVTPFATAFVTAIGTRRALAPEQFETLSATPLSNFSIVSAWAYTALYRLRAIFLALIALIPLFIVENFAVVVKVSTFFAVEYSYGGSYDTPTYWGNVGAVLVEVAFLLGLLHMNVLAAAVGVHSALKRRSPALTLFPAPTMLLMVMLSPLLSCLVLIAAPHIEVDDTLLTALAVIVALVLMLAPGPVAYRFMRRTAEQWRRQDTVDSRRAV
jgi:hypothetical protein